jgi:hypothetical protein
MKPETPKTPEPEEVEINEADELREEDRKVRAEAKYAEMDRRDRAGPHYWAR